MNFNKLIELYEHQISKPEHIKCIDNMCFECNLQMAVVDGLYTCINCGLSELHYKYLDIKQFEFIRYSQPYKRKNYFKVKLYTLMGRGVPKNYLEYVELLDLLRMKHFQTVFHLYKFLKQIKKHRYTKFIYKIWYDLYGIKLIRITNYQSEKIIKQFCELEQKIKNKQFFNYNLILYLLFKLNNIDGYKNIILPYNCLRLADIILKSI